MSYLFIFGISLLVSLVIVVISSTVLIVVIYLEGSVTRNFFILYLGVVAVNLAISAVSLKQLLKYYPIALLQREKQSIYVLGGASTGVAPEMKLEGKLTEEFFTRQELEIIAVLKGNGNRMLQNSVVALTGISKASVSRVIASLENKGAIIKIRHGVTNEIILSETYCD